MTYQLEFNLGMFTEEARPVLQEYFEGKLRAFEAARKLGWTANTWNKHLAGLFSLALLFSLADPSYAAVLRKIDEQPPYKATVIVRKAE